MIKKNNNEKWESLDLNETFNEINISNTIKSLNKYIVSLDSFYTTYT